MANCASTLASCLDLKERYICICCRGKEAFDRDRLAFPIEGDCVGVDAGELGGVGIAADDGELLVDFVREDDSAARCSVSEAGDRAASSSNVS